MKRLIIDDKRTFEFYPDDVTVHARTQFEGMEYIMNETWDEVWFDHDLGDNKVTGEYETTRPIVFALEEDPSLARGIGSIVIQSANPVGAVWIKQGLMTHWPVRMANRKDMSFLVGDDD